MSGRSSFSTLRNAGLTGFAFAAVLEAPPAAAQAEPAGLFTLCLATMAPITPRGLWWAWSFAPFVVIPIALTVAAYARGVRLSGACGDVRPASGLEVALFGVGICGLCIAVVSPLCRLASALAWAHMVQHVLLVALIPPLVLMGRGASMCMAGLLRRRRRTRAQGSGPTAGHLLAASVLYGAAIWIWHIPRLYEAALLDGGVHLLMYASLISTSLFFWHGVIEAVRAPDERSGLVVLALLMTLIHTGVLGAILVFSGRPWFPFAGAGSGNWGLTPLEDQQLAGLIMWVPMGFVYLAAGLAVMAAWLAALGRAETAAGEHR